MRPISEQIRERITGFYRPPSCASVADWVRENLRIEARQSADYAGLPMDVDRTPHARIIYDFLDDPVAEELNVMKSSAAAMTSTLIAACFWVMRNERRNILYLIGNQAEAKKMATRYWKPWVRQVFGDAVADEETQAALHLKVNGIDLISGSPTEKMMRGIQFGIIIEDESDTLPNILGGKGQSLEVAERERVKNALRSKIIRLSTPLKKYDPKRPKDDQEGARMHRMYLEGDQRVYHCHCPGCGVAQPFGPDAYDQLVCDNDRIGAAFNLDRILTDTQWECPTCRRRVSEGREKEAMVKGGFWKPTAPGSGRIWSAWHTDLVNLIGKTTWGRIRHDIEKRRGTMEEAGVKRAYLAIPEDTSLEVGIERDKETILRHCGHYRRGTCPVIPWRTTLYVDVQKDCARFPWVAHALLMDGAVYVLDWGEVDSFTDLFHRDGSGQIRGLVSHRFPLALNETEARTKWPDPKDQPADVRIVRAMIDSGYMARGGDVEDGREESVYGFCLRTWDQAERRLIFCPAKGRGGKQILEPTIDSVVDFNGAKLPLLLYDDWAFKRDLYNVRLASDPEAPTMQAKMRPRIYLPRREDIEEDHRTAQPGRSFLSQLLSERIVDGPYPTKGGVTRLGPHWHSTGPHDYGDGLKGGLIMHAALCRASA